MLWSVLLFENVKVDERTIILVLQIQCSVVAGVIYNFKVHVYVRCEVGMKFTFCIWLGIDRVKKFV